VTRDATRQASLQIDPFGEVVEVRPGESALDAILREGRFVRHGCKHGGCGTCRARLVSGDCRLSDRTSFSLTDADRDAGIVLLCSTYITAGEAVVDLSGVMELDLEEFRAGSRVTEYTAEVIAIERMTREICAVRFHLLGQEALRFSAGQYVEVEVPGAPGEWRSYSMSSAPSDPRRLEILVKLIPNGRFSSAVERRLSTGDPLRLRGPLGQFAVHLSHRPMVMVSGGSGMGPIRSMLLELEQSGNRREVTLFHGARRQRDLFLVDELRGLERQHDWFRFVPALSEPEPGVPWDGEVGRVTDAVAHRLPDLRGFEGYLCGPPGMIDAAIRTLIAAGCKPRHIFFDRFVPSGGSWAGLAE
jgi:NAD(P)H-flavin reductase/ferredoxin